MVDLEQHEILLSGTKLSYIIRYSTRAHKIHISVSPTEIIVTLPQGTNPRQAVMALQKSGQWLLRTMEKQKKKAAKIAAQPTLPADVLLLHGKALRIQVIEEKDRLSRARIEAAADRLFVYVPAGNAKQAGAYLQTWLIALARQELSAVVKEEAQRIRVSPGRLSFRDQRTRWGSCSRKNDISLNWRLVMAPPEAMHYVIIHELCHIRQHNHSRDFWALVAQYCPRYKEQHIWLRKNGSLLRPSILI